MMTSAYEDNDDVYHQNLKNSGINGNVNKSVLGKLLFLHTT